MLTVLGEYAMCRIILLSAAIMLGWTSVVSAQSILEAIAGLKFCRTLKDDAQRLKCFDGIATDAPTANPAAGKPDVEVAWTVDENKSPLDDSPQVSAAIPDAKADATLVLRCKEKKTEAIFSKTLGFLGTTKPIKVVVRINEGKLIETQWSPSTTGSGAFAPSAVQFIKALPDQGKLFIRALGFNGNSQDGEFSLGKVSEIRDKIAQACNWKSN
jgi:hypothetical protein